ncbi:MAG TPA: polysaccharide deacetylase family protein [Pseudolabrys sp.]|nr:polysaccharide deacetylase family protein [Pseudolabrys sp.]
MPWLRSRLGRTVLAVVVFAFAAARFNVFVRAAAPTNGLIMLIEFEKIDGIHHWERELNRRKLTALVQAQFNVLDKYPQDFERLAAEGYTIAGIYAEKPFWDVPYEEQLARMREAKAAVERITGKPMRVFGSRYFAYDENTLRAADALGIEYVLGRGTAGALATIYAPREYKAKIISVSNVPFAEMGTGSLCDYSLWARGSTGKEFGAVVDKVLASGLPDLILVSHAYLGGMYKDWWQVYERALADPHVRWRGFDAWVAGVKVSAQPYADIPVNREVKYDTPKPAVPLPQLELLPGVGKN